MADDIVKGRVHKRVDPLVRDPVKRAAFLAALRDPRQSYLQILRTHRHPRGRAALPRHLLV
jgi:hypothetical protein